MECTFARFRYGPTIQTVALYPGIPIEELLSILSTILPVVGKIVGLQDEVISSSFLYILLSISLNIYLFLSIYLNYLLFIKIIIIIIKIEWCSCSIIISL